MPPRAHIVVAGEESAYLRVLAEKLGLSEFSVDLVVEEPSRPFRAPLPIPLRICESLYQRIHGFRLRRKEVRLCEEYWRDRLPEKPVVPVHHVPSLNGAPARTLLAGLTPDLMLTYGPRLLKRETFALPRLGTFNLHGGKLPDYRGTLTEFWTLRDRRFEDVGVSLHRVTEVLDGGEVYGFLPAPGKPTDDDVDARFRWQRRLLWVIADWLRAILDGTAQPRFSPTPSRPSLRTPHVFHRLPVDFRRSRARRRESPIPVEEEIALPPGKRAAVAISSDIDETSLPRFEFVHRAFQERLGWSDFADSLFFFQADHWHRREGQVSLFRGTSADEPHPGAHEAIRQALRRGGIETNHAWGDFNDVGGFHRSMAEGAVRWLEREGVRLPVFVEHGDAWNEQDLFRSGDLPSRPECYNLDLARRAGARYFWSDQITPFAPLGGRPPGLADAVTPSHLDRPARLRPAALILAWMHARTGSRLLLKAVHRLGWQYRPDHRLVWPHTFRDGSFGWLFQRSGRWERDDWRAIEMLLSPRALRRAVRDGGAIVVYTHLGKGEPPDSVWPVLESVARRNDIWLTSVHRLLDAAASMVTPEAPMFRGLHPRSHPPARVP